LPLTLSVTTNGSAVLDLRPFLVSEVDIAAGEGRCIVWLPSRMDSTSYVSGDELVIRVPDDVGVRILGADADQITTTGDYDQTEDGLESADYNRATARADVLVRPATGAITVEPASPTEQPERQSI